MTGNPRNAMVYDTPYLQKEFGDPRFFYVFSIISSFSTCSQSFKKICTWELLGANVLKFLLILLLSRSYGNVTEKQIQKRDATFADTISKFDYRKLRTEFFLFDLWPKREARGP